MTNNIVVVEDDQSVREMLAAVLSNEGYAVDAREDAEQMLAKPATPEAVTVLDVGLPGMDGIELCAHLRRRGHTGGILMLTARHEVSDRVAGLDAGADDYLVKPFALDELLARVRALTRRTAPAAPTRSASPPLTVGDVVIDEACRDVHVGQTTVDLTRTEFDLLHLLALNRPAVMRREVIHDRIWGYPEDLGSNTLEVFISQVRRKLAAAGSRDLIQTVRGVGYAIRTDVSRPTGP